MATLSSTGRPELGAGERGQAIVVMVGAILLSLALVATIVGGTGRFAGAAGTFTMEQTSIIDFATGTSSGSGSFDGAIIRMPGK